jgi:hypothetical protein
MQLPNHDHPCQGCFLEQQRGGRVCPAAREVYGLPDIEAERHATALHAAVLADAQAVPGFAELVRHDAFSRTAVLPAPISLGLVAAPTSDPLFLNTPKEVIHVVLPPRRS